MDQNLTDLLVAFVPLLAPLSALAFAIFGKPQVRHKELKRQRPNLLDKMEYNLARDIANVIPDRSKGIEDTEYLEICETRIHDRIAAGVGVMYYDYFESEHRFAAFVCCVRLFTYGTGTVVLLELLLFIGGIEGWFALSQHTVIVLALVGLVVAVIAMFIVSVAGDLYDNYLDRYKICGTDNDK